MGMQLRECIDVLFCYVNICSNKYLSENITGNKHQYLIYSSHLMGIERRTRKGSCLNLSWKNN